MDPIDVVSAVLRNTEYRQFLYSSSTVQLVAMSLQPGEDIEREVHRRQSQFVLVFQGAVMVEITDSRRRQRYFRGVGEGGVIAPGAEHYVVNQSFEERAQLLIVYAPPVHRVSSVPAAMPPVDDRSLQMLEQFLAPDEAYLVGRGGSGMVYANDRFPRVVVKLTNAFNVCADYSHEYGVYRALTTARVHRGLEHVRSARIVESLVWQSGQSDNELLREHRCALVVERVYSPRHASKVAIHAYLNAADDYSMREMARVRGIYVGPAEVARLLNTEDLRPYARDLGRFMADVHYHAKYDGLDMEFIVGHTHDEGDAHGRDRIYVIDFDLVSSTLDERYAPDNRRLVDRLETALSSESYFPTPDVHEDTGAAFSEGYLQVAEHAGYRGVAERVLQRMQETLNHSLSSPV